MLLITFEQIVIYSSLVLKSKKISIIIYGPPETKYTNDMKIDNDLKL